MDKNLSLEELQVCREAFYFEDSSCLDKDYHEIYQMDLFEQQVDSKVNTSYSGCISDLREPSK